MFHACVQRFDVMGTVEKLLGTKQSLSFGGMASSHIWREYFLYGIISSYSSIQPP